MTSVRWEQLRRDGMSLRETTDTKLAGMAEKSITHTYNFIPN